MKLFSRLCFAADAGQSVPGVPQTAEQINLPQTGKVETPPPPAGPTAAGVVLTGTRTEREIDLEAELATERERHATTANEKKAREIRVAELEDELHRLKSAGLKPTPAPARAASRSKSWTLFDEED